MTTHPIYDQLLLEITDETERRVFQALADRAGEKVTRPELVFAVFNVYVQQSELGNCTEDRKVRECIERLQRREYPILASSGEAGYVLLADDEELNKYILELASRRDRLVEKIAALMRSRRRINDIRTYREAAEQAKQLNMFVEVTL